MKIFQTNVTKKIETHILFLITFFENRAVYAIMWTNFVERGRPQMTIWRMCTACWKTKVSNKHTGYVVLIRRQVCTARYERGI